MEASPLIKAHDHARAASEATHASNSTVAINEHTKAAGEFANAAKSTSSVEALRTLKLLEQHHQRLSELLSIPLERAKSRQEQAIEHGSQRAEEKGEPSIADAHDAPTRKSEPDSGVTPEKNLQTVPSLSKQQKYPSRDLGTSIANNLASARGIRTKYSRVQPLTPSLSNTEAPGNLEPTVRRSGSGSKSKMQSMIENAERPGTSSPGRISRQASIDDREPSRLQSPAIPADEGFSKFYSAFGSIINKISAPLAFAGLPLISEESMEEPPAPAPESAVQKRTRLKASLSASAEPDMSKLYSRATLRAIARDGQSATDSFYVVPTSGHTASYASILSYADKEKRRMEASFHGDLGSMGEDPDEEDFVDARESQVPVSPGLRKKAGKSRSEKELSNVVEELYLENKSLKDALDKLSKRLHAFESMSQTSGMRLAESMRLMRPGSPHASGNKAAALTDDEVRKQNQELEERVLFEVKRNKELQKEFDKAQRNLLRYRERWDQLKAGAKARRAGAQGSSEVVDDAIASPTLG